MTLFEAQKFVADAFQKYMDEEGFETFDEMRDCYWREPADVKEEVALILSGDGEWFVDDECKQYVICQGSGEMVPYGLFVRGVYKLLHARENKDV